MARVLVVDDDEHIRGAFRTMLEQAGYEVDEAHDGRSGIMQFARNRAELVVTDIVMPERDGLEVIMTLRRMFPDVKILAISGGGRISPFSYLEMAKNLGADAVLVKPVEKATLLDTVASLLDGTYVPPDSNTPVHDHDAE